MCDDKTSKFFKQSLLNEDYSESSMTGSKFNILEVDFKIFCNSLALTI